MSVSESYLSSLSVLVGCFLFVAGCNGGTEGEQARDVTSTSPDATPTVDGTDESDGADGTSVDADAGEQPPPWFEREPSPTESQRAVSGYVFASGTDEPTVQPLVDGENGRQLEEQRTLEADVRPIAQTENWIVLEEGAGQRLQFARPWDVANPVHQVDIAQKVGTWLDDAVYHPGLNETFLVTGEKPKLFVIEHGRDGGEITTMDLSGDDSDENPDPVALAVDGETLLVGLSQLHPEAERTNQNFGDPAEVAVVDAAGLTRETTLELPHTNVRPGFDRMEDGDFAVGLAGNLETEPDEQGFVGTATDGGIYRLERMEEGSYSVGSQLLSEEDISANLTDFDFIGPDRGVVSGSSGGGSSIHQFDMSGETTEVATYESDTSMQLDRYCVPPEGGRVGVTTGEMLQNPESERLLVYEGTATSNPEVHTPSFDKTSECSMVDAPQ